MPVLMTPPFLQFLDANGDPLAGGKVYTYAASTLNEKATYTDESGATEHPNPIILDASGRATIWINGSYKFRLYDSADVFIRETDDVTAFTATAAASSAFLQSFSGDGSTTGFTLSEDLGTDEKALMVFIADSVAAFEQEFSGDGSTTAFTLSADMGTDSKNLSILVDSGGAEGFEPLPSTDYTVSGTTLTITSAPASGTDNILVKSIDRTSTGVFGFLSPNDYTVNGTALTFSTAPSSGTNNIIVTAPSTLVNAASASAAAADVSANAAAASATAAATSETNAGTSESNASSSASAASSSASAASTSESNAASSASAASSSASAASTSETNAAASAAATAAALTGTSTTSVAIGTGSKGFTTQASKSFEVGKWLLITSDADPTNYMHGQVTAYSGTSLTVNITNVGGSGTLADWTITLSGTRGAPGVGTLSNVVEDTSPEAGGDFYMNGHQMQHSKGADVASAAALPIITDGNFFDVTGTTTITSINTTGQVGTSITLQFDGALTLTHHATNLILPTGANITTAAGDVASFTEYASGDFICTSYTKADGTPLAGSSSAPELLHIQDQKTSGTAGGTGSVGANTRTLNTVVTNEITGASLASNQITLPAGTYEFEASCPHYASSTTDRGGSNSAYLYNVSDSTEIERGQSGYIYTNVGVSTTHVSKVCGKFTLGAEKDIELRQYLSNVGGAWDFGNASSNGVTEVYAEIRIWKVG